MTTLKNTFFLHTGKIFFILLTFLLCFNFSFTARGSHSMGADLTYTCLGGNTYKLRLAFYRDCLGVAEPVDATILITSNSCGQNLDVVCTKIAGTGQEITPLCPSATSTCNGGIYTGIEEWIYEGTVVLPMQCTDWVFSFTYCCRNTAITTINDPGNNDFHIFSTLNNTINPCNNSPTFSNKPVPFVCVGQQYCFNHGAYDSDGDSLVYSLITPQQNATTPVTYFAPYSATQPLNSVPPVTFSSVNGDICMTPQSFEVTVMAVLVQEYRNGVLVGSVERDIQVTVINCTNNLPTLSGINGTGDITATICANNQFCFDLYSNDTDAGQNVTITYDQSIPGATFSSNSGQLPVGTFCWTPSTANISTTPYCFTVSVQDNACPYIGSQVYSFCLTVTGITADAGPDQNLGCNQSTTLTANGGGGNPPYTYLWSDGSNTQSISAGPGTYTVTVSDGLCTMQDIVTVASSPLPTISSTPVTDVLCNGGSEGTITVTAIGGTGAIQYSIDNGVTYQVSNVFNGLAAGTYTITITDANGCTASSTANISEPTPVNVSPASTTATCTNANGTITLTGNGGIISYQYSIDNGITYQPGNVFNGLSTGNYNVMIQDANGCTAVSTINVPDEPPPTVSALPVTDVSCNSGNDGTITINYNGGTGVIEYSIDNGITYQAGNQFPGLSAGTYFIMIRDANGCTATATATIAEPPPLVVNLSSVTSTCSQSNGSVSVTANGGTGIIEYSIDNGTTYQSSAIFSGLPSGNYDITIKDANGCTASASINVPDEPAPAITATPLTDVTCNAGSDGSVTVSISGGTGTIEYSIDNGITYQVSNSFTGLAAGTYSITIQDDNGCTAAASATITEPSPLVVNPSAVNSTCSNSNGSISISANGGTGTIQFSIDNGATYQSSSDFSGLTSGNYNIMVQDANGCTAVSSITVPDESSPVIDSTPVFDVTCNGGTNGEITVNTSGGTGAIQYSIDNGTTYQGSNIFSGLAAGNYSITIQDANGCTAITNVPVAEPAPVVVNLSSITATCSQSNGSVTVSANGGTGTIEFSIDNGVTYQSSPDFSGLSSGNYDIVVRDANGCTATATINVPDEPSPAIDSTPVTDVSCNAGSDGIITVNHTGGTGVIQYSIDNGTNYQSSNIFTGLVAGTYTVTVQDANGCTAATTATIAESTPVIINTTAVNSTCSNNNGSVSINANGGTGSYQYSIDNGLTYQSSSDFSGLSSGTYDVTVQDANGCTAVSSVMVPDEPSPTISSTPITDVTCNGGDNGSISVVPAGGTGVIEYSLDGTTFQTSDTFSSLTAGSYTVTIRDENGCTATINVAVAEPGPIVLNATTVDATCNGSNGSVQVNGNGGTGSLEFSIDGGITYQPGNNFTGLAAGNYSIIVMDANGCLDSITASVSNALAPVISSVQQTNISCNSGSDGTVTVNAIGGTGTLEYSIDNGVTFQTGNNFTGLPAGNYNIVVKDANGCLTTSSVLLDEPSAVIFSSVATTETCENNNGSISISASGGTGILTFSIDNGSNFQPDSVFTGLNSGSYDIVVKDNNGCTATANTLVPDAPSPTITSAPVIDVSCNGGNNGSISINAVGGSGTILYSIDNGTNYQTGNVFNNLTASSYQIFIQDTNGCTATTTAIVTEPDAIILNASSVDATCNGSNGSISMNGNGGTGTLQYSIDGGLNFQTGINFSGLVAGNYNIIAQDDNGCTDSILVTVNNALAPAISSTPVIDVTCNAGSNGSITVNANGGTGILQYSIDNGNTFQSTSSFSGLIAGLYDIVVMDANGCLTSATVTVIEPPAISFSTITFTETCSSGNGSLSINANGGTGNLQYSIDGGISFQASENFTSLSAANYNIVVQDANGCTQTGYAVVPDAPAPVINSVIPGDLTCSGSGDGSISINASGGSGILQYSINGGNTYQVSANFSGLAAGSYYIVVNDTNNCEVVSSIILTEPSPIVINSTTVLALCGNSNGSLTLNASGGNGIFQYSIDSGLTFVTGNVFNGLAAANYNVVVQDGQGCTESAIVAVSNAQSPAINAVTVANASCFGLADGSISINANGGAGSLEYSINNGVTYQQSNVFSGLPAGNYSIVVIDSNDCQVTSNEIITEPPQILVSIFPFEASCGNTDGSISLVASGGTGALQFSIDSTLTFQTDTFFNNLGAGNYTIIIEDATGCQLSVIGSVSNINGPVITGTQSNDLTCYGSNDGSITINVSGGVGILNYSIDNGVTFQSSNSFTSLPGGTYSLVVTDANNCIATEGIIINEPDPITFNLLITDVTCGNTNGVIDIYATGGTGALLYSVDSGMTFHPATIYSNLAAGNYTIITLDANGCSTTALATINNLISPAISALNLTDVSCFGGNNGTAGIVVSGGASPFTYLWSNGGNSQSISGLTAGNYSVTVTDADLCTATQSFIINEPSLLVSTSTAIAVSCFGDNNGSVSTSTSGGTVPYTYLWSSGGTSPDETNLVTGNYSVIITDYNGCSIILNDSVSTPAELIANSSPTAVNCFGYSNGAVTTTVSGGTFPYNYLWSTGASAASLTNIPGGNYTVTVTDNNNCAKQTSAFVFEPTLLTLSVSGNDTICITQQSVISATANGGTLPYSYLWNNGITSTSQVVSPVVTTSYSVSVTDANGCYVAPVPVTVAVNAPLIAAASDDIAICDQQSTIISVSASGGNGGPYTYLWDNNAGTGSSAAVSPNQTTTYTVTVSDNCGTPPVTDTVVVTVNPLPVVSFIPLPPSGCVPLVVNFTDSTLTSSGSYYEWDFGDGSYDTTSTSPVHTYYEPGSYDVSLSVTTQFGCTSSLTLQDAVIVYDLPVAEFVPDPYRTSILNPHIYFTDHSIDAVTWEWDFGDGTGISTDQHPRYTYQDTGTYKITLYISNQFGCRDTTHEFVIIDGDYTIYVPNAFTPNGDGINEYFYPQGIGIEKMQMLIFNRWGQKVFVSSSVNQRWDGTHMNDNTPCAEDVYIYVIRATDLFDKGHEFTGRVTLVR